MSDTATDEATGGCTDEVDNAAGGQDHVDPGTEMEYEGVPPVSGKHWGQWPEITARVYEADERPELGELVHSQEHGWTIVWYADGVATRATLPRPPMLSMRPERRRSSSCRGPPTTAMPSPTEPQVAMTHWGGGDDAQEYRQYCASVSADAVLAFTERRPYTDSHEPDAP